MIKHIKNFVKNNQAVTLLEYGLIAALIAVSIIFAVRDMGEENRSNFFNISNNLSGRQAMLDNFYQKTIKDVSSGCNQFGSCGSKGNQAVWDAFVYVAIEDTRFDHLLTTQQVFESQAFKTIRQRTQSHFSGQTSQKWHNADNARAIQDVARKEWQFYANTQPLE